MSSYIATSNNSFKEIANTVKVQQLENTEEPKIKLNAHFGLEAPNEINSSRYWIQCNEPDKWSLNAAQISTGSTLPYNNLYLQYNSSNMYNIIDTDNFTLNSGLYQGWIGSIENKATKINLWKPDTSKLADKQFVNIFSNTTANTFSLTLDNCYIGGDVLAIFTLRNNVYAAPEFTVDNGWELITSNMIEHDFNQSNCRSQSVYVYKCIATANSTTFKITYNNSKSLRIYLNLISLNKNLNYIDELNISYLANYSENSSGKALWIAHSVWSGFPTKNESLYNMITDSSSSNGSTSERLNIYIDEIMHEHLVEFKNTYSSSDNWCGLIKLHIDTTDDIVFGKQSAWVEVYNGTIYEGE